MIDTDAIRRTAEKRRSLCFPMAFTQVYQSVKNARCAHQFSIPNSYMQLSSHAPITELIMNLARVIGFGFHL